MSGRRDERAAAREQAEGEDGRDAAEDEQDDPARSTPFTCGRERRRRDRCRLRSVQRWGWLRRHGRGVLASLIEPERRIRVGHQTRVDGDARDPTVEPEDELEDASRVARREEKRHSGEENERADEACLEADDPDPVRRFRCRVAAAEEDPDDDVVGDGKQPPLHEHEPAREPLRVGQLERRRVLGVVEREGRVAVGAERAVRVEHHPPRPAQHSHVEVEDPSRVAAGEEDREERDHRQHQEGQPEEEQHHEVRDRQQPLDEPEPAAQARVERATQLERRRVRSLSVFQFHRKGV